MIFALMGGIGKLDAVTSIQTQSTAETLTPEQVREQEFVKLHNDTTRLLEQRRAVENAPPHHAPILQSIMTELDALRGINSATSAPVTPATPTVDINSQSSYTEFPM